MKRSICLLCLLLAFCLLTGCSNSQPESRQDFLMGTFVSQIAYGMQADAAMQQVADEIARLESIFSAKRDDSECARVNRAAGSGEWTQVSAEFLEVLKCAQEVFEASDGALNIALGKLVSLWGIGTDAARVPSDAEIAALLPFASPGNIEVDEAHSAVRLQTTQTALDFGALAKGYAADRAADLYRANDVRGVITIGGNAYAVGTYRSVDTQENGSPFKIGIRNPEGDAQSIVGYVEAADISVVTSGDYERFFEENGIRYHHILDPETGKPAQNRRQSAGASSYVPSFHSCTIVGPQSLLCDALSTAVFVLGEEQGRQLLTRYSDYGCVFIREDYTIGLTENLRDLFHLQDASGAFTLQEDGV